VGCEEVTVAEFRAWLEGFEEAMGGKPPTAEQWKAIKSKLARVTMGEAQKSFIRRNDPTAPWWDRVTC